MVCVEAPRSAIVHYHSFRQAVSTKEVSESLMNGQGSFVATCLQSQGEARMVVQHGEGVAAALPQSKMPLKVHLPQLVGFLMLKALPGPMFGTLGRVDPAMTPQYGGDGAWTGYLPMPLGRHISLQLTPAPRRVGILHFQHQLFHT